MLKGRKVGTIFLIWAMFLVGSMSGVASGDEDVPLVNGEHWTKSSRAEKVAYIVGAGNLMVLEYLYQGEAKQKPTDDQTVIQRFYKGVDGLSLDELINRIDQWYSKHPDKLKEPVLVVVWHDIVEPNLASKK